MYEVKLSNGEKARVDDRKNIVVLLGLKGSVLECAQKAIQVMEENPEYAGVCFMSTARNLIDRKYIVFPGMSIEDFKEEYKKECRFEENVNAEAIAISNKTPERKRMIEIEIQKGNLDPNNESGLEELKSEWARLEREISAQEHKYRKAEMSKYYDRKEAEYDEKLKAQEKEKSEESQPE